MTTDPRRTAPAAPAAQPEAADPPHLPGAAGSPEALRVLQVLHQHPQGLLPGPLADLSGLSREVLTLTLHGLRRRGRAICVGNSRGARWLLPPSTKPLKGRPT